jgi:Tol biopolymer transport system component
MCLFAAFPQTRVAAQSVAQSAAQNEPAKKKQSPNGQIVFQSTQGGDGFVNDIYVMDADGKRQTRLTYTPNFDETIPIWSPKGDQIAFQTNRGGNGYELYLMDADGSNQRPLRSAAHGGPIVGSSFEWSPDGKRLAYASGSDVYVIKVSTPGGDDSKAAPVSVSGGRLSGSEDIEVSWSPSGNRLVVRNAQNCGGCTDLYTVNADGTNRVQVTNGIGFDQHPRWSPSGMFIAYEADRGGRGIYVIKADGTGTETKVSGAVGSFGVVEWAPDGSRLAFKSSAEKVYLVNPDGSGLTLLTDVPADGGGAVFWSPDSAKVAFHNFNSGFVDIYVVNADGSGHKASNYTKTKRDDEFACNWQRLPQENREQEDRR